MLTSRADVTTDAPERYAKQLAAHLGRRLQVREEGTASRLLFDVDGRAAHCLLVPGDGVLAMEAQAPDEELLARVEDVVGRHLERFGQRGQLEVTWRRG